MPEPIRSENLVNGLQIRFYDQSNRYFGDFHRVRIVAQLTVPVSRLPEAQRSHGELCYEKVMERMGVPTAELSHVRTRLIDDFLATSGCYLGNVDFPKRLLEKVLREKKKPVFLRD